MIDVWIMRSGGYIAVHFLSSRAKEWALFAEYGIGMNLDMPVFMPEVECNRLRDQLYDQICGTRWNILDDGGIEQ